MKQHAYVVDGQLVEIIPDVVVVEMVMEGGDVEQREVPLADRYHAEFVAQLVPYDPSMAFPGSVRAPHTVPRSVMMRQARLALHASGHLAEVDAALDALPAGQREVAKIEWEFGATVERDSVLVTMLAAGLQLDDQALDELFSAAAKF